VADLAFVFPGQGSQIVGMGRAVYEQSARARDTFDEADRTMGYELSKICFAGPSQDLDNTTIAQPAILTTSVAILEAFIESVNAKLGRRSSDGVEPRGVAALPASLRPRFVAGHSLGEFTALVAAGVLTFQDALRLVTERGRLAASRGAKGAMAAIVGLPAEEVERVINDTLPLGSAVVANDNGPSQVTIAGDSESVARASEALTKHGARKVVPLRISAPFHFPDMGRIGPDLAAFMHTLHFHEPVVPIVANVSAMPHPSASAIPDALVRHLSSRVEWLRSVRYMAERGASTFVEIGAGQVVNGLVKRIADVKLLNVSDPLSITGALWAWTLPAPGMPSFTDGAALAGSPASIPRRTRRRSPERSKGSSRRSTWTARRSGARTGSRNTRWPPPRRRSRTPALRAGDPIANASGSRSRRESEASKRSSTRCSS
jgi:[acyl-carrier-protein] S-malonyltransferase